jgi:kynurenine formamidase
MMLVLLGLWLNACARPGDDPLQQLFSGQLTIVDLTYPLNDTSPYWPGSTYNPFQLDTLATLEKDGVLSLAYSTPEHLGTHLDAPNHFAEGQIPVDQIAVTDLFGPAVVVDVVAKAEADPDYRLSKQDLLDWEAQNGRLPAGAIVLMYTGWGKRWSDYEAYKNADEQGRMHFPGFSEEAARFLVEERDIKGIGIDNLSVDYGLSKDFVVHHIVNGAGKYHLENVANLDKLPAKGANLIVAPVKIEGGSGGQARIFAVLPE